jgi:hypothetical protein
MMKVTVLSSHSKVMRNIFIPFVAITLTVIFRTIVKAFKRHVAIMTLRARVAGETEKI